jgi:8-oxo-dGTP pyrophosphatase MutT (NUDIX family)
MPNSALAAFRTYVEPVFRRPEFVQAAALCLREGAKGPEVLLVSSLTTKRWILPKGWPMSGRTLAGAALQEAWEEAGVKGSVAETAIGQYSYRKSVKGGIPVTCRCDVFQVDVDAMLEEWPEKGRRKRAWFPLAEAAKRVDEPELKALLRGL